MKLMKKIVIGLIIMLFLIIPRNVLAIEDPTDIPNNPYGIHIIDTNDLDDAARLVNSSGGDWGYVTLVVRKDERNIDFMQSTFNKMRRLHLIPIIRIASKMTNDGWEKLTQDDIDSWVYFLNSLNWVVKNRYVIIGNEPNHASEWGNEVNPQEYARYLKEISEKLRDASDDFFIMPAGFDASAPNDKTHMDEVDYIKGMLIAEPGSFNTINGWVSHSYPNPNFSGSENDHGRGTVRTFEWENEMLKTLGINRNWPVFITETGWINTVKTRYGKNILVSNIADKLRNAYANAWNTKKIIAVTPFLLNYQTAPFDIFSWKKQDGSYYDIYYDIQRITKVRGQPHQYNSGQILAVLTPKVVRKGDRFYGIAYVKNTGQIIWQKNTITLIQNSGKEIYIEAPFFNDIEPGQKGFIFFSGEIDKTTSENIKIDLVLINSNETISDPYDFEIDITNDNVAYNN
jgi:hypothetical protein